MLFYQKNASNNKEDKGKYCEKTSKKFKNKYLRDDYKIKMKKK